MRLADGARSDRQTWELLRKLNAVNSPSFYNYGGRPPQNVLDLGCGQGHWMLDAAIAWQAAGTQITGFDMVDMTKALWPVAQRQGVLNKIKFVRGNFVKQPLPFADGSFQLVRMASLALCIPYEKWDFVLHQVRRVLAPPLLNPSGPPRSAVAPHLDTMIPNTVFSRMSLADVVNPTIRDDADSEIYNLYGVEEEGETSDTDTAAAARELESLFEHMMNVKFGIHLRPSEFVFEIMMRIFGGAKEVTTMHLTLAPPDQHQALDTRESQGGGHHIAFSGRPASLGSRPPASVPAAPDSDTLGHCPGLILWPSTFIPMPLAELETHASKHLRVLLSCKSALAEYAAEIADQDESENQSEAAMEALWEYENFIRERFNPPPDDPTRGSDTSSASDTNSMHNSVFSVTSVGSDAFDAMREYQTYVFIKVSVCRTLLMPA
ncbi:hypothetical protein B0H10DRAFT_2017534 [Mycena sp. CBHHK59/15]|nr:hypothetical protein B0H10DRAFT_2017534 [Mycena sp. CBHHK59/15]